MKYSQGTNPKSRNGFKKGHIGYKPMLGKKFSEEHKSKLRGESNHSWKGENVSYVGLHKWVAYHYGSPKGCENCGTKEDRRYEWANISRTYKRDRNDFIRLCVPCHRRYDLPRTLN